MPVGTRRRFHGRDRTAFCCEKDCDAEAVKHRLDCIHMLPIERRVREPHPHSLIGVSVWRAFEKQRQLFQSRIDGSPNTVFNLSRIEALSKLSTVRF